MKRFKGHLTCCEFYLVLPKYPSHADLRCFVHVRICWEDELCKICGQGLHLVNYHGHLLQSSAKTLTCFSLNFLRQSIFWSTKFVELFGEAESANPWVMLFA